MFPICFQICFYCLHFTNSSHKIYSCKTGCLEEDFMLLGVLQHTTVAPFFIKCVHMLTLTFMYTNTCIYVYLDIYIGYV